MRRRSHRLWAALGAVAAVVVAAPLAGAAPQGGSAEGGSAEAAASDVDALARPAFRMPFRCDQVWTGSNWNGHSPAHSIDWNHYDANGNPDDLGRVVLASAGGRVVSSHYSTTTGYGNTIVIDHGDGWRTRYAHLKSRGVAVGAQVTRGQRIGTVGATSAKYNLSPHLHYEQIHNGSVVVSVVQGVRWSDFLKRTQRSTNNC
ncbi:peptidoglycan DD-metalloendopeptidase family protein [Streptomyces sp. 3MP-14]|uniref:Peptidoglycan DD-metalloendopeptidase family protein n=1 Tax=Streptomyces mimosae TaxID=2586635 RepID=A0A5N6APU8_9ACTN|nr:MULTISPECIES: M23 family metallopeptidase [Streptomyces]KAB8169719.1 peptidoglycan DD-metalloendopeptidase family protein [Streptomyces mimosae]KAB8178467.1 peptidoglycan DD-metalloendopeptidase family protein [Streptomyces sp. 3MP-14]